MKKIYFQSKMMLFVMAILLPLNLNVLNAQSFYQVCSTGQCLKFVIYNGTNVSVAQGADCLIGNLVIPSIVSYNGTNYSVSSIGINAFYNCSDLTAITIPNTVTSIGNYAFSGCSGLTSISIPNSVTSIGNGAFYECSGLTSITIPNSVSVIYDRAFDGCSGLTSITIPSSVSTISGNPFSNCSNLSSIVVSAGNTAYDSRNNCNAVIYTYGNRLVIGCQNSTIPNSVTSIGNEAFSGCSGLTSITIPNSVSVINDRAFDGCSGLTSITIPNSVSSIGGNPFVGCSNLSSIIVDVENPTFDSRENCNAIIHKFSNVLISGCKNSTIPNTVTSIGDRAFSGCSGLTSITIPNSVTSIGWMTFAKCSNLTSITIPNSVISIDHDAFWDCSSMTSITIPNQITTINTSTFEGCSGLTTITIPQSVTSIDWHAFADCSSLTSINIPNSVTSINNWAFWGCSGLTSIIVDAGNPNYDSRDNCNAIIQKSDNTLIIGCKNSTIPNSITSIGGDAFFKCTGLTSISIPNSVTSIGLQAFGFSGLTSINIPNSVTSIDGYAFTTCSNLTSVTLPNSISSIGNSTFYGCSGLTSITIPDSVSSIGNYAFYECFGLTSINIPNSVTSIGSKSFYGCSGLTSVTLPNSVTSIGTNPFSGCLNLSSIIIENNNPTFDSRDSCNAIIRTADNTLIVGCQNTVIPASISSINNDAFTDCVDSDTIICLATTPPSINGCSCHIFDGATDDFRIIIPCGTLPDYMTAWSDLPYLLESGSGPGYDTSITIACPDSCYTWNSQSYCASGDYTQTFQTIHGCDSVVTLHLTITVGVNDYDDFDLRVYPNPTSNIVNVQCTMNNVQFGDMELQLVDTYGRLLDVVRANVDSPLQTAQIDLSQYATGIYFLKAVAENETIAVQKVVKQ